jgi:hypothetical protein
MSRAAISRINRSTAGMSYKTGLFWLGNLRRQCFPGFNRPEDRHLARVLSEMPRTNAVWLPVAQEEVPAGLVLEYRGHAEMTQ